MNDQSLTVSSGGYEFTFTPEDLKNIVPLKSDLNHFSVLSQNEVITGKIISDEGRYLKVELEGETFDVKIKSSLDMLLQNLGIDKPKVQKIKALKAPMPGLVIEINVTEGQTIKENEKVLILEAMKMENILKLPHEAVVKKVCIEKGQAVEKGQTLIELE
jgi:biotin carboxyl carrier protein